MVIPIILLLLMSKRFISRTCRPGHSPILQRNLIPRARLIPTLRLSNLLIPIWSLCIPELAPRRPIGILDAVRAAGTAARAQHPEEAGGEGECHGEPGGDIDAVAERAVDIVFFQGAVECANKGGVEDCACEGERDDEEGGDGGDDGGGYASQAGEESEEADANFDDGGDESDEVGDEHPFGDNAVGVEAVAEGGREELFDVAVVETPDCDGVEPEFVFMRGAVCYVF